MVGKRARGGFAGLALLAAGVLYATAVPGAVLLQESFEGISSPDVPGRLATAFDKRGWTAGRGGDELGTDSARYLSFPLPGAAASGAGTLELHLVRGGASHTEALFAFVDARGNSNIVGEMRWDGLGALSRLPVLSLSGVMANRTWLTVPFDTWEEAKERGRSIVPDRPLPSFQLPRAVPPGGRCSLAFTWGPLPDDCRVYFDGEELPSAEADPASVRQAIENSVALVLGAEPEPGANGGYSLLAGVLQAVRVSDRALRPGEFLHSPAILSVGHDASRVAGYSGFLVEGQALTLTLEAETGGKASCDVGDVVDIPLAELPDRLGVYGGVYTVKAGDFADKGAVVGRFRNLIGLQAEPVTALRQASVDGRVHLAVKPGIELVPADKKSRVGVTVVASDANGRKLRGHPVKLTLSTTDEYTGLVGSGLFAEEVGGKVEVDWGGVTDSFGEVTARYQAGFAAKTVMVNAKDMLTGDIGFGAIRSFIEGNVDITVKDPSVSRLLAARGVLEVSASRAWLTADGVSRSRITARVRGLDGKPVAGDQISFTLIGTLPLTGDRGQIRVVSARTDSTGRAWADYIAGTVMGQVQVEVRDLTLGLMAMQPVELRADAPAEIILRAEAPEVVIGGKPTAIFAKVSDVNGNPNSSTEVQFALVSGEGTLSAASVVTGVRDGKASVNYTPGGKAGVASVRATVVSRLPTATELATATGAVFLFGLATDPGELTVKEWKAETKDQVVKGQELVSLEDRRGNVFTVKAPRDGILSVIGVEKGEAARMGDTLAYVLPLPGEGP